jgi:hypothetical protein
MERLQRVCFLANEQPRYGLLFSGKGGGRRLELIQDQSAAKPQVKEISLLDM